MEAFSNLVVYKIILNLDGFSLSCMLCNARVKHPRSHRDNMGIWTKPTYCSSNQIATSDTNYTCHICSVWEIVFFTKASKQLYEVFSKWRMINLVFISLNKDPLKKMKVERGADTFFFITKWSINLPKKKKTKNWITNKFYWLIICRFDDLSRN